jgi:hypothetical protein
MQWFDDVDQTTSAWQSRASVSAWRSACNEQMEKSSGTRMRFGGGGGVSCAGGKWSFVFS